MKELKNTKKDLPFFASWEAAEDMLKQSRE